jgi:hypothetical protein
MCAELPTNTLRNELRRGAPAMTREMLQEVLCAKIQGLRDYYRDSKQDEIAKNTLIEAVLQAIEDYELASRN